MVSLPPSSTTTASTSAAQIASPFTSSNANTQQQNCGGARKARTATPTAPPPSSASAAKRELSEEELRAKRYLANSRERQRTEELNDAFKRLRQTIPSMPSDKMSKIHTLKIAANYIRFLDEINESVSTFDGSISKRSESGGGSALKSANRKFGRLHLLYSPLADESAQNLRGIFNRWRERAQTNATTSSSAQLRPSSTLCSTASQLSVSSSTTTMNLRLSEFPHSAMLSASECAQPIATTTLNEHQMMSSADALRMKSEMMSSNMISYEQMSSEHSISLKISESSMQFKLSLCSPATSSIFTTTPFSDSSPFGHSYDQLNEQYQQQNQFL